VKKGVKTQNDHFPIIHHRLAFSPLFSDKEVAFSKKRLKNGAPTWGKKPVLTPRYLYFRFAFPLKNVKKRVNIYSKMWSDLSLKVPINL
jgi:hypothetical protein